jgi:hypothetical protein
VPGRLNSTAAWGLEAERQDLIDPGGLLQVLFDPVSVGAQGFVRAFQPPKKAAATEHRAYRRGLRPMVVSLSRLSSGRSAALREPVAPSSKAALNKRAPYCIYRGKDRLRSHHQFPTTQATITEA